MSGFFLTLEGIEGTGKTTQLATLEKYIRSLGFQTLSTRQPGGTSLGQSLRSILLHSESKMDDLTELLLYAADRAEHHAQVVEPALAQNKVVLCDRHLDATLAYQGAGRGIDQTLILDLHSFGHLTLRPQLTLWIDVPVEESIRRARQRNADHQPDENRFEEESISFHTRVREGYRQLCKSNPDRIKRIEGLGSVEQVSARIVQVVTAEPFFQKAPSP